ncbi:MAG: type II secretion system protein [Desulfurobacteriaceae bacterium]
MKPAFTLLEVIIAVAIVGLAFSSFLALSGKMVEITTVSLKTTLSTVAVHNAINEVVYARKSKNGKKETVLNYEIKLKQNFEDLMGYRVVKVEDWEGLVEVYEVR